MTRRRVLLHHVVGTARWCDSCHHECRFPIYAYAGADPTNASEIGTYCPNCTKDTP
ncbi:hypothetical protein [Brachybacterium endophyticum]|uniref:hypothetical protein n=1 Tax=Brachybacterium endophyticum TaxID=2182385 RepID=UPI001402072F|nr:hypothetical protein [Brachybacterium endophyticum]